MPLNQPNVSPIVLYLHGASKVRLNFDWRLSTDSEDLNLSDEKFNKLSQAVYCKLLKTPWL